MRSRSTRFPPQSAATSIEWHDTAPNPDVHTYYGMPVYYWVPMAESIIDDPVSRWMKYRSGVRRRVSKPVEHRKYALTAYTSPIHVQATSTGYWTASGAYRVLQQRWLEAQVDGKGLEDWCWSLVSSKAHAVDFGHYDRWQAVKPSMASRANLTVSLLELRDIKKMWDILPKKHFGLQGWDALLTKAKYLNGLHLNYNFGWKPFVSDVVKSFGAVQNFDTRLRKLLNEADRDLMKRFRDSPAPTSQSWDVTTGRYSGESTAVTLHLEERFSSQFHFAYSLPDYSNDELRWRAWADALGLKASPSNVWAIVPWSFVVDWFYDVGGLLASQESDWIEPWVTIYQSSYSRRLTGELSLAAKCVTTGGTSAFPGFTFRFSWYSRSNGLPNFSGVTDSLDADKIRLGASLLFGLLA